MVTSFTANTANTVCHGMLTSKTADTVTRLVVTVFHRITTYGADSICAVAFMGTFQSDITQSVSIIAVVHKGKCNFRTSRDKQLVSVGQLRSIVQRHRGHISLPPICHIPIQVIRSLYCDVAVLSKEYNQGAINKLIHTQIGTIVLVGIIGSIDIAKQIIIHGRLCFTALGTDVVAKGMVADSIANCTHSPIPNVIPQLSVDVTVHDLAFHLTGLAGSIHRFAPIRPFTPTSMGIELCVVRIGLCIDVRHKEPCRVGCAGRMGSLVAVVGIVAGIVSIRGRAVICMECGVASAGYRTRIVRVVVTPVIIQISGDGIAVNNSFGGFCFRSCYFRRLIVILGIKAVGSGETGRPAIDVIHRSAAGFLPSAANLGISIKNSIEGGGGFVIAIAINEHGFN